MGIVKRPTAKQVFTIHATPHSSLPAESVGIFVLLASNNRKGQHFHGIIGICIVAKKAVMET